jgi:hypothetical protein
MLGSNSLDTYTLIVLTGSTIVHPMLDSIGLMEDQPSDVDITHFENAVGFVDVLNRILR